MQLSNDEKLKISRIRKLLRIGTIIFTLLTIILAILTLAIELNPIFAVICFIIEVIMTKYSEKINYKK